MAAVLRIFDGLRQMIKTFFTLGFIFGWYGTVRAFVRGYFSGGHLKTGSFIMANPHDFSFDKSSKIMELRPIPCEGKYTPDDSDIPAMYLGAKSLTVISLSMNSYVVKDIVPIPVQYNQLGALTAAALPSYTTMNNRAIICDRNHGLYDNLRSLPNLDMAKVYRYANSELQFQSPYHQMVAAVTSISQYIPVGLFLEVSDIPTDKTVLVGGAVVFISQNLKSTVQWKVTSSNIKAIINDATSKKGIRIIKW